MELLKMKLSAAVFILGILGACKCLNSDELRDAAETHIRKIRAVTIAGQAGVAAAARSFVSRLGQRDRVGSSVSTGSRARWSHECLYDSPIIVPRPPIWPRPPHPIPFPRPHHRVATTSRVRRSTPARDVTDLLSRTPVKPKVDLPATQNRDYIFVLDTSGSISNEAFEQAKEGLAVLVESFCPVAMGSHYHVAGTKQVAVVMFSDTVNTAIPFSESSRGLEDMKRRIVRLQHKQGPATATANALAHVRSQVLPTRPSGRTATLDVIVVTDGRCNKNCKSLAREADALRNAGANLFALGIDNIRHCELEIITGLGDDAAVGLRDFQEFAAFTREIKKLADLSPKGCV